MDLTRSISITFYKCQSFVMLSNTKNTLFTDKWLDYCATEPNNNRNSFSLNVKIFFSNAGAT